MKSSSPRSLAGAAPPLVGCSSFKLRQLSRRVSQEYDAVLADAGLKTSQYSLLSKIVKRGPIKPGQLAAEMEMDASTLTRNLQPLVARGWAQIGPGEDGRSRRVSVTVAGREKRAEAKRTWKRAQLAFNARLGTALVGRLHEALDECLALMGESPDPGE